MNPVSGAFDSSSVWRYSRGGCVEGLKDDLHELLPVAFGVEGSLRVKMGGLVGGDAELVVEGMMPDLLHVIP
jgi:hypothetical protein